MAATFTFADELVSQTRYAANGRQTTRFIQADGFGSTRWLTDGNGAITDAIDYDAFGVEIGRSGSTPVEHLYRGEAFDDLLGFYYLRARWMDSRAGRFTQMDEWQGKSCAPRSLNAYVYTESEPINNVDPSGYMTMGELTETLGQIRRGASQGIGNYRIVVKNTGCLLIEAVAEEAIKHGVYIFLDELANAPYVGKTKNNIDERLKQHAREYAKSGARIVGEVLAKFQVSGSTGNSRKNNLQIIEQLILDLVSEDGANRVSNSSRSPPLSPTRPSKKKLRARLAKIKLCD